MSHLQCPSCGLRLAARSAPSACPRCLLRGRDRFELVAADLSSPQDLHTPNARLMVDRDASFPTR
jgi:hypothetical protein